MESVNDLLKLFMRQAQLERAMKHPCVTDEKEFNVVGQQLAAFPEAMKPVAQA